jgi:hypothetical protein
MEIEVLGSNYCCEGQKCCQRTLPMGLSYTLLILLVLLSIFESFSMDLVTIVGLGNAGGSDEPQWWQRQMAVLPLPHGKTFRSGKWVFKP